MSKPSRKVTQVKSTVSKPASKAVETPVSSIPDFRSELQEREFWERTDSTSHVDWSQAQRVRLPNLKPTSKSITLRLPASLLDALRVEANKGSSEERGNGWALRATNANVDDERRAGIEKSVLRALCEGARSAAAHVLRCADALIPAPPATCAAPSTDGTARTA